MTAYLPLCSLAGAMAYWRSRKADSKKRIVAVCAVCALVPVLANVGFRVTVFDNREDFARQENYPAAEQVIFGDYYHIEEKVHITPRDYVVIMTPGHQADREVLLQAMKTPDRKSVV